MDLIKLASTISEVWKEQYISLEQKHKLISNQLVDMLKGGGMSIWPKPILHITMPPLVGDVLIINEFYNKWYQIIGI
jgi:hypothetical protein